MGRAGGCTTRHAETRRRVSRGGRQATGTATSCPPRPTGPRPAAATARAAPQCRTGSLIEFLPGHSTARAVPGCPARARGSSSRAVAWQRPTTRGPPAYPSSRSCGQALRTAPPTSPIRLRRAASPRRQHSRGCVQLETMPVPLCPTMAGQYLLSGLLEAISTGFAILGRDRLCGVVETQFQKCRDARSLLEACGTY